VKKIKIKLFISGYNSDMMLTPLIDTKREYLERGDYNLFFVDWSVLGRAPCYPSAVHNTRHVGFCISQLVARIRETGNEDIHIIGFSLGAQVSNYVATSLKLINYTLPRITGLGEMKNLFFSKTKINFIFRSCHAILCHG
jgi:pancreatic lipase-related protein 2